MRPNERGSTHRRLLHALAHEALEAQDGAVEPDRGRGQRIVAEVRFMRVWLRGFDGACSVLTTDEARTVAASLQGAGLRQDAFQRAYGLTYYFDARGIRDEAVIRFEPFLPHGEVACSGCG